MKRKRIQKKITIGQNADGTPIRKSFNGYSLREIEAKIKEYHQNSQYQEINDKITLAEWADKWLETYKKCECSAATIETDYTPVLKRVKRYFKDARLCSIRPLDIQNYFKAEAHMSDSRLKKAKYTLKAIFESAIDNELIYKNPVKGVKVKSKQTPEEKRAYTQEEANDIIEYAKKHKYGADVIVMLRTGLRRGELLALKWQDINLKAKTLSVKRAVSLVKGRAVIGEPKNKASKDDIAIPSDLIPVIKSIPRMIGVDYIFHSPTGKLYNPNNWAKRYNQFMEDYKSYCLANDKQEPRILHAHELRHTFGSIFYNVTHDLLMTSKAMRHASTEITAKVYIHTTMEMKQEAAEKLVDKNKAK